MSDKRFVFAADRHGREDDAEGDIYIGAGDEIYAVENGEEAEEIEEHQTGLYGNADDRTEVAEYAAGELDERFAQLSEEYEEVYLGLGNHEDQLIPEGIVQQVAQDYDNINILNEELVEIEGRNFYFADSFQTNNAIEQIYDGGEVNATDVGYEKDDLEEVGEALGKDAESVTCNDIDQILEGEIEIETENDNEKSHYREKLENLPILGEYIIQPLYDLKDRYLNGEEDSEESELPDIEKTEQHEQLDQDISQYEEMLDQKTEKINEAEGEVTLIAHGQPQTENKPFASIETRELLERSDNIGSAYVGHFHGGFEGEKETEISGVNVINPMEGYTIDKSGGALTDYEHHSFEGDKIAEADPIELEQPEIDEEEHQKVQEIMMEVQEEAESQEEFNQMLQQRLDEEGIEV